MRKKNKKRILSPAAIVQRFVPVLNVSRNGVKHYSYVPQYFTSKEGIDTGPNRAQRRHPQNRLSAN